MEKNKKVITEADIQNLLKTRMKNPNLTYEDIYRGIDEIHPSYTCQIIKYISVPVFFLVASMILMVVFRENWIVKRISIIVYSLAAIVFVLVFKHYGKKLIIWIFILCMFFYLSYSEDIDITYLWNLIKTIF